MLYENIPAELKQLRQWVVWRSIIRVNEKGEKSVTKPPFNAFNPMLAADTTNPGTWSTYDEAVECVRKNSSFVEGIGFVFTDADEYFGIDIDDEQKVNPEHLEMRKRVAGDILERVHTYAEISPSGKGVHLIGRGRLPSAGKRNTALKIEVYGSTRFFTMTGNVLNNRREITDQQAYLDILYKDFVPVEPETGTLTDITNNRRLDLSDDEVIRLASNFHQYFAPRFNCQLGCDPGQWSETFMFVVGLIDRFTGSVEQVERIIMSSPMVTQAKASNAGEPRAAKARRNLVQVLQRVRKNNSGILYFFEHGRQQFENIEKAKSIRAAQAAENIRKAEQAIASLSSGAGNLLAAFRCIDAHYKVLCPPPGIVGEFVACTVNAMVNPFEKFAIPAVISSLTGVVARGYKLPGGGGLNVNMILVAPSSTGKTQSMRAWSRFQSAVVRQMPATVAGPPKSRVLITSTSSIQGIMKDFMDVPSVGWFVEECASLLAAMSRAQSTSDSALRDSFNQMYDCGEHGVFFSPPRSVAGRTANIAPIENFCVSTYWTTVPSKFELYTEDALDGFLSRVVVIRHMGASGELRRPTEAVPYLPEHLARVLFDRMMAAKALDEAYALNPAQAATMLTAVSTAQVEELAWEVMQIADRIKTASLNGELPPSYTAISRMPVTALRIAGMCAVMENPYSPSVTPDQLKWAVGYLLQNLASVLSDIDQGEMGVTASHDTEVFVREMKRLLRTKYKAGGGVPKGELIDHLKRRSPFKDAHQPGEQVKRTLADMMGLGRVEEIMAPPSGKRGRPGTAICPTDDDIWTR